MKRPLLRANWKEILIEDKYGKYDKLKKAFNKWEKYMNPWKSSRMSKEKIKNVLSSLLRENNMAYFISKLIVRREELKFM